MDILGFDLMYIHGNIMQTWLAGKAPNWRFTTGKIIVGECSIAMFDYERTTPWVHEQIQIINNQHVCIINWGE